MQIVKTTEGGISYLRGILRQAKSVVTRVCFLRIPHHQRTTKDICLKIGRYKILKPGTETPEYETPKSELTLDKEEFSNLIEFLQENYAPFKDGVKQYIALEDFQETEVQQLKEIFNRPDKRQLAEFIAANDILPADLIQAIRLKERTSAVKEYEAMLDRDLLERDWQAWFERNPWVLGSEFVGIIDDRTIDPGHVADYLMQAYDGFLDLIEIKRPHATIKFWSDILDHGNYIPSQDLTKAVTQATRYIFELEREANSLKFLERVEGMRVVKPRCILIFGRSCDWNDQQKEAYRLLNATYHNILIMTYDHVLDRAKRILNSDSPPPSIPEEAEIRIEDIPF